MLLSLEIIKNKTRKIFCIFALQIFVSLISYQNAFAKQSFPLVWNISNSNEYFVGRKNVLDLIHKNFKDTNIISIVGSSGIGKTQIAKKYTEIYRHEYDIVWWIDADKSKSIDEQFKKLAEAINSLEADNSKKINVHSTLGEVVNQTKEKLRTTSLKWLLVFDNSLDMGSIRRYLPERQNSECCGNIMITSKNPLEWYKIITIENFTRKESIELLAKVTNNNDIKGADELAETLRDFPLALIQAATYIKLHPTISFKEYKENFIKNRARLWEAEDKTVTKHSAFDNYNFTVFTTLSMIVKELENNTKHSLDLLALCSFVHNKNIPKSLFLQYLIDIGMVDRLKQENIISSLLKYSLIYYHEFKEDYSISHLPQNFINNVNKTFTIHEITQLAIQDYFTKKQKKEYLVRALSSMVKILPDKLSLLIPLIEKANFLISHMQSLSKHSNHWDLLNEDLLMMKVRELEYFLSGKRNFIYGNILLEDIEKSIYKVSKNNLLLIRFYLMKAMYYVWKNFDYSNGIKETQKALDILNKLEGHYAEEYLMVYNRLIQFNAFTGNREVALKYAKLGEDLLNNEKDFIGNKDTFYHSLAKIYMDDEQFDKAYDYSIKSIKYKLEPDDKIVEGNLPCYILACEILIRNNKMDEALKMSQYLYETVTRLIKTDDNFYMGRVMTLKGYIEFFNVNKTFQKIESITMLKSGQDMIRKVIGNKYDYNHPAALSHIFLGDIYHGSQRYAESLAEYNIAEEILNNYYGYGNLLSSDASDLYSKLAILYSKLADIDSAQKYLSKLQKELWVSKS